MTNILSKVKSLIVSHKTISLVLFFLILGIIILNFNISRISPKNNLEKNKTTQISQDKLKNIGEIAGEEIENMDLAYIEQQVLAEQDQNQQDTQEQMDENFIKKILKKFKFGSKNIKRHAIESDDIDSKSVTSRTIKNNTIKGKDIKDGTIKEEDIKDGAITADKLKSNIALGVQSLISTGDITVGGTIYGTISGGWTPSGNLDMQNNLISNIGVAGTDFTATGGLTLADMLTISSGGLSVIGNSTITGNLDVTGDLDNAERVYVGGILRAIKIKDSNSNITKITLFPDDSLTDYGAETTTGSIEWAVDQFNQPTWVTITDIVETTAETGTVSAITSNKLEDTDGGKDFTATVVAGMIVRNTSKEGASNPRWAYVTAIDDANTLSLSKDIFRSGETGDNYVIQHMKVTAAGHGLVDDDTVYIRRVRVESDLTGLVEVNDAEYTVFNRTDANNFSLKYINGNPWGNDYVTTDSAGQLRKVNTGTPIGGEVHLACGEYQLQTEITQTEDNISYVGDSKDCVRLYADPTLKAVDMGSCGTGSNPLCFDFFDITGDHTTFNNLELDGNVTAGHEGIMMGFGSTNSGGAIGSGANTNMCAFWVNDLTVDNVYVHHFRKDAFHFGLCAKNIVVSNFKIFGQNTIDNYHSNSAFKVEGVQNVNINNGLVYDSNRCLYPRVQDGYDSVTGVVFADNVCRGIPGDADNSAPIIMYNNHSDAIVNVIVTNNYFDYSNITAQGSQPLYAVISDNIMYRSNEGTGVPAAIYSMSSSNAHVTITGNKIIEPDKEGIQIDSDNTRVIDNEIYFNNAASTADMGIYVSSGADGNLIEGNLVDGMVGTTVYGIRIASDNNTIRNNTVSNHQGYPYYNELSGENNVFIDNYSSGLVSGFDFRQLNTTDATKPIVTDNTGTISHTYTADGTTLQEWFGTISFNVGGNTLTYALPDGTIAGGRVQFTGHTDVSPNPVITIANCDPSIDTGADGCTCTFDNVADEVYAEWSGIVWLINQTGGACVD